MVLRFLRRRHVDGNVMPDMDNGSMEGDTADYQTLNSLKQMKNMHRLDPNLPLDELDEIDVALKTSNAEKGAEIEQILAEDNSPYPEVRASVRNFDVEMPANTIRAWSIGLLLCTIGSAVNMLLSLRNPSILLTTFVIQLIAYPIGLFWDVVFPDREIKFLGFKMNFKPGPFNVKEHVVIVVMSNAAYGGGALYATDVIIAQQVWYGQNFGWLWQLLFGITTLCTGYGLAGLARRFLVWPAAMIWPTDLVNCALFYTLHDHSPSDPARTNGWTISRYKWFLIIFSGSFLWYWVPGYLFQGLQWFCWITWIYPDSVIVNQLFGGYSGYGLLPMTLDWSIISGYLQSPLIPPFHATANVLGGIIVFFVFASFGIHYSGMWYSDYLPVQNSHAYDNTGVQYDVSRILGDDLQFDEAKYKAYSPLYLPTQFALAYGLAFATVAAVITHVAVYHGKEIWTQWKLARHQEDDVHMRLMKKYRDAEDWWYIVLFGVMIALSLVVVCAWDTEFPWWAYIICMLIPLVWTIPIGIVQAITNIQLGLNVLTEFIVGYMLPGRPLAMMMFKNYGYLCMSQALYFTQDLKLGHYMKVPPRVMFWSQLIASVWSAIVQVAVMNWALATIPDVCSEHQRHHFNCPNAKVFYTASIIWGAIGPARMFSGSALYSSLQWFWLVGAIAPIATYFLARRYSRGFWRYVNMPLVFGGSGMLPPATVFIFFCWGIVGGVFNYFIRRRKMGWWLQYNYVTSAALDCGLILSTLVVFFALVLTSSDGPKWFGNNQALSTLDMNSLAVKSIVAPGEKFGPTEWP
ncbi:OPT oligopeptide transporter protein-domain-containing protein [Lasiosphaeria miniovina]|uniref:OPT oligopeptide transporter protein-domain-containing protein n=1 Tax=Lasiosphaeria miniovina TaxID=1954250 RepID=A0AA40DZH3_9PEZI|nr:OPT oligopeptide transporter protein-domain-containing protein [Lasiosphaeria miniovina]KAK0717183.1 OPT oligopeptide transporter protein-domain-containing protein [Lasiosphaeria miniovina]